VGYAIIRAGGKQYRVEEGSTLRVPLTNKRAGETVELDALLTGDADGSKIGSPLVEGVTVTATVVNHGKEPKTIVFKKKRRKHYKRKQGHRQGYTTLKVDSIG
jgi:large subunit ribosomal protein L21